MDNIIIDYENLPVYKQRAKILDAVVRNQIVIIDGNTGSGKTTQIPVILHEAGYTENHKMLGITQPRRIAAISVSSVMASQLRASYPDLAPDFVQYKIRFNDKTTHNTQIKVMTDGILLQEIKHDKLLSMYSVLVIDEAHERSLNIDFILGLLGTICEQREDFKIIISSATINAQQFSDFFLGAPVITIDSPLYPVEIRWTPIPERKERNRNNNKRYASTTRRNRFQDSTMIIDYIVNIVRKSVEKKEGDILIFLPGEKNIKDCLDKLSRLPRISQELYLLPLYGRLEQQLQERVFSLTPAGKTKVVMATNIAETSITIDKISVVIDTGKVKLNYFHYQKLTSTLSEVIISRASADQRRGRAGRTNAGICYRLYTKDTYDTMEAFTEEEILRTDLSEIILRMAHLDIRDFENFKYVSPPSRKAILSAIAFLQDMDALDENNIITEIGKSMMEFPLSPAHARILVETMMNYPEALSGVLIILAFLTTPTPFLLPLNEELQARTMHHKFADKKSDFFTYIKLLRSYMSVPYHERPAFCNKYFLDLQGMNEIVNVYEQLSEMVVDRGVFVGDVYQEDRILKPILKGLMYNICVHYTGSTYVSRTAEKIYLHPGSVLFDSANYPPIIVAGEIVQTSKIFAHAVSRYNIEWIQETNPYLYGELKKLIPLSMGTSKSADKRLHSSMRKNTQLFSVSKNVVLNTLDTPKQKKRTTRDTSRTIRLGNQEYVLSVRDRQKVLEITWKQVYALMAQDFMDDIERHGTLRCNVIYNVHVVLYNIKLSNVYIMYKLYGSVLPFVPTVPPAISIMNVKKKQPVLHVLSVLNSTMNILIPASSKLYKRGTQKGLLQKNIYKFLALRMNQSNELYVAPELGFISALQTSLYTLGVIESDADVLKLSSKIEKEIASLYRRLTHAYDISEEI